MSRTNTYVVVKYKYSTEIAICWMRNRVEKVKLTLL